MTRFALDPTDEDPAAVLALERLSPVAHPHRQGRPAALPMAHGTPGVYCSGSGGPGNTGPAIWRLDRPENRELDRMACHIADERQELAPRPLE